MTKNSLQDFHLHYKEILRICNQLLLNSLWGISQKYGRKL